MTLDPSGSAQVTELLLLSFWLIFENNLLEKALSLGREVKELGRLHDITRHIPNWWQAAAAHNRKIEDMCVAVDVRSSR